MAFHVIVFQPRLEEVVVTYKGKVADSIYPDLGFRVPALFKGSTALHITEEELLPPAARHPTGSSLLMLIT